MLPLASPEAPLPTVQLRHELPDGSWHIDWMLARDPQGTAPLLTWRLARPLDALEPGESVDAEHIGDHRPDYLDYEGPVSGDRGHVTRIARGRILEWGVEDGAWRIVVEWEPAVAPAPYVLERGHDPEWRVTRLGAARPATD